MKRKTARNLTIFLALLTGVPREGPHRGDTGSFRVATLEEGPSVQTVAREYGVTVERVRKIFEQTCRLVAGEEVYQKLDEEPYHLTPRRMRAAWWIDLTRRYAENYTGPEDISAVRERLEKL